MPKKIKRKKDALYFNANEIAEIEDRQFIRDNCNSRTYQFPALKVKFDYEGKIAHDEDNSPNQDKSDFVKLNNVL